MTNRGWDVGTKGLLPPRTPFPTRFNPVVKMPAPVKMLLPQRLIKNLMDIEKRAQRRQECNEVCESPLWWGQLDRDSPIA